MPTLERALNLVRRCLWLAVACGAGLVHARDQRPAAALWSLRPLEDPPVPAVVDADWPANDLDRFILARLEGAGLRPVAAADRIALLRRVTHDLTGLPPTPDEVQDFLADDSPAAWEAVVDRLLASPRHGERWGRHWLDVARYADSNGLDENIAHGNAWRYRDYVVGAFNRDKPFDEFLLEQLAGDLLPASDDLATQHERLIATGFLSLGPKVLAEVDEKKMEMDIVDEQVDTLGRSLLGLTVGCARCHDHKFDPVSTEDYYALAGILKSTRTMEHFKKIARWHESSLASAEELARKEAYDQRLAEQKLKVDAAAKGSTAEAKAELEKLQAELKQLEAAAPVLPAAMGVQEGEPCDLPVHLRGSHLDLGPVVPRGFPQALTAVVAPPLLERKGSGRLDLARWLARPDHPLTHRVLVNRIWRWHFGRGLVPTVDNFGRLGEPPTHPELLDWLVQRFIEDGRSLKRLHRLIVLSQTYRLGSQRDARALEVDPEDRLCWRWSVRRLEAEALRDSLLAVSGLLDLTMGGSLLHVKNREFFFDHTSRDTTRYDSLRRSIYLPVVRNHLYDVFQLFDCTDAAVANGDRSSTTVAPQALFHLNSELVGQAAESLAASLLGEAELDDAGRLERLYTLAYSRGPTGGEARRAREFLEQAAGDLAAAEPDAGRRRRQAWAHLCQAILAANEFVYLE